MRGFAYAARTEFAPARSDFDSFTELAGKVGNPVMLAHADDSLACLAVIMGDPTPEDRARVPRSIQRFRRISNCACRGHGIYTAAAWLAAEGRLEDAARSLGVVQALRDRLTMVVPPYEDRTFVVEGAGLDALDIAVRAREFDAGRSMEPEAGIDWVVTTFG